MSWTKRLSRVFRGNPFSPVSRSKKSKAPRTRRVTVEPLEDRRLLSVGGTFDFGDLPDNYGTTLVADGARHEATGPTLGALRDTEVDGQPTTGADGDDTDSTTDEDGVTFGEIRVGQLDAQVTVNVRNAPDGAKLDAWIDFNGDGSFGGPGEQIAASVAVSEGDNLIEFDVPSWSASGQTYARFRLSMNGDLAPDGAAADGEVEDYQVTIMSPGIGIGNFITHELASTGQTEVFATDLDGDGDMDVLATSYPNDSLVWYENGGHRQFTAHTITTSADGAATVYAADMDGDGDVDVLLGSAEDDTIAWYENDGEQNFTGHTISASVDSVMSLIAADVDTDGDLDVVSCSRYDGVLAWYENDGQENFTAHVISTSTHYPRYVSVVDLDSDGDMDLIGETPDQDLSWFENDGSENFTPHTVANAGGEPFPFPADIDSDGDMDVFSGAVLGYIMWHENDGSGDFTSHALNDNYERLTRSVFAADVDGDGDMDLLTVSDIQAVGSSIDWFENNGNGDFTEHRIHGPTGPGSSVFVADLDGDGDLDVLSNTNGALAWHEQGLPPIDFGDAPDTYGTTLAADGARHEPVGPTLGWNRDAEEDGHPTAGADGDDTTDQPDEYGVRVGLVMPGQVGAVVMVPVQDAPNGAKLDAWIDFDGNGTFDAGDQIADSIDVVEGENVIRFDVPDSAVAGQTYARFRLSTAGDLDPTGPANDGEVEDHMVTIYPSTAPVDLGVVDYVALPRFDPSTDPKVYTFTTKYAGYLTVLADEASATGSLAVHLFDESGNLVGDTSTSTGDDTRVELLDLTAGKRYTLHVSGPESEVDLEILNLVEQVDGAVTVHGTDAADEFYYLAGSTHRVLLNGLRYDFDPATIGSIHFACGAGDDYVSMTGSAGDETAILRTDGGSMTTTATGFTVSAEDSVRIAAHGGGGNDMVEMIDGEGDDVFYIWAHRALLQNPTESGAVSPIKADDFSSIHVYAKNGGNDTAKFQGTDDAERVKVYPEMVKMTRGDYFTRAKFFEHVEVDTELGVDTTIVTGSDGADVVWASSYATRVAYDVDLTDGERPDLHPTEYGVSVSGTERIVARATGGDDWIELHDSPVNDVLIAKPHRVDLMNGPRAEEGVARGAEYRITARGYGHVTAIADSAGDGDVAKLYDSGEEGVDIWAAAYVDGETWSTMTSPSRLLYEVLAFEHVGGYGFNGGLGEDHGVNRKDHADDVDFVFQYGYWEGDEEPGPRNPRNPRG